MPMITRDAACGSTVMSPRLEITVETPNRQAAVSASSKGIAVSDMARPFCSNLLLVHPRLFTLSNLPAESYRLSEVT